MAGCAKSVHQIFLVKIIILDCIIPSLVNGKFAANLTQVYRYLTVNKQ